jgi:hypothetical protein
MSNKAERTAIDWGQFKYMVFDNPKHPGTFGDRYNALGKDFCNDKE